MTMEYTDIVLLSLIIGVVAFLYSSVGHAGASGYIAVMALWGLSPPEIRPTALVLNILVASIGAYQFWSAGHFSWKLFWPFALLAAPAAYFGGYLQLPVSILKTLIGLVLLFSAARLFFRKEDPPEIVQVSRPTAIGTGAAIGFLSGLTGTGGGIFLTPTLLFFRWARIRQAAAVSALFILVNSISGLAGYFTSNHYIPALGIIVAPAAVIGGVLGSHLGSRRFPVRLISLLLATVLVIAGAKLIFTR
jgi:uncharacterized membrane protein YfcA